MNTKTRQIRGDRFYQTLNLEHLTEEQRRKYAQDYILENIHDKRWRLENLYLINSKEKGKCYMKLRPAQADYLDNWTQFDVILKSRQHGLTTFGIIDMLDDCIFGEGYVCTLIAHDRSKMESLFEIARFAWDNMPNFIKEKFPMTTNNSSNLKWKESGTALYIASDLRSGAVNRIWISEADYIKKWAEMWDGSLSAISENGGRITVESTAKGMGSVMHALWKESQRKDGEIDINGHFFNWLIHPDCRDDNHKLKMADLDAKEKKIYKDFPKCTLSHIAWRRGRIRKFALRPDTKFGLELTPEQMFDRNYPTYPIDAFVSAGANVFPYELIDKQRKMASEPIRDLVNLPEVLVNIPELTVYEKPSEEKLYVAATDVSEGVGQDYHVTHVLDAESGAVVAVLRSNDDLEAFRELNWELLDFYHQPLWGVERASLAYVLIKHARDNDYFRLYREASDISVMESGRPQKDYGWRPTREKKNIIIAQLLIALRNNKIKINHKTTLDECQTFLRDPDDPQKMDAAPGHHDDCVMSLALAFKMIDEVSRQYM